MASQADRLDPSERELLAAARDGDEGAFERLVDPYRGELHAHCYRMLGSVHDAEDALQESLLRAWRGLPGFEGRSSLRSWLYRIATNASLDDDREAPQARAADRLRPGRGPPRAARASPSSSRCGSSPTPMSTFGLEDGLAGPEARYEQRESVELAFVAALQNLPANQRAVLILREVLGFSAKEAAETLDTTTASVNSALQRARAAVEERLPEQSQQATARALGDDGAPGDRRRLRRGVAAGRRRGGRGDARPRTRRSRCPRFGPGSAAARRSPPSSPGWPLSGQWRWHPV